MVTYKNPDGVLGPQSPSYSHLAEVKAGSRMIFIAGQVGVDADGNLPGTLKEQAANVYANLAAILKSEGMDFTNVTKFTTILIDPENVLEWREAAAEALKGVAPPNTLLYIKQLASPDFKIEIEAVAAEG